MISAGYYQGRAEPHEQHPSFAGGMTSVQTLTKWTGEAVCHCSEFAFLSWTILLNMCLCSLFSCIYFSEDSVNTFSLGIVCFP